MSYVYKCCYKDFGCNITRTRKDGINKHQETCQYVKYKKYVDALNEVKNMRLVTKRGRPEIPLTPCNVQHFQEQFINDKNLQNAWRKFNTSPFVAVKALIVVFLNVVPRFFKLKNLSEIEVCGNLGFIRTYGRIERHPLFDITDSIYGSFRDFLQSEYKVLGYSNRNFMKDRDPITNDKVFMYNVMATAIKRKPGDPIVWKAISYKDKTLTL